MHNTEFNTLAALAELYSYAFKYNDQLMLALEEDEFSTKQRLAYKLEQVHNIMSSDWQDAPTSQPLHPLNSNPPPEPAPSSSPTRLYGMTNNQQAPHSPTRHYATHNPNNSQHSPTRHYATHTPANASHHSPSHHYAPPIPPQGPLPPHYQQQLETVFSMRGEGGEQGGMGDPPSEHSGGGSTGMEAGELYSMYGVPHPRLSPAPFHSHYNNRTGPPPQVYEFDYEEPHFTWANAPPPPDIIHFTG